MPPGVLLISHCAVVLLTGLNARKTQKYAIGGVQVHGLPLARLQCTFSDPVRTGYRRVAINRYCIIEATSLSTPYCCFYSCLYVVYPYLVCCSTVMCSNSSTSTHRSALENRKKILHRKTTNQHKRKRVPVLQQMVGRNSKWLVAKKRLPTPMPLNSARAWRTIAAHPTS